MAIECAASLRRVARVVASVLIVSFMGCISAAASVGPANMAVAGSILNMPQIASADIGSGAQIYKIVVAKNGSVLFLDTVDGALYQLAPGATSVTTVSASGDVLYGGNKDWNTDMALDANDVLYLDTEYTAPYFWRVAYDPTTGTWPLTGSDDWAPGDAVVAADSGARGFAFLDDGDMVVGTTSPGDIYIMSISADGSKVGAPGTNGASGSPLLLVKSLTAEADKMTADHAGNIFFIEGIYSSRAGVAEGVWEIPYSVYSASGFSTLTGESKLTRLDPPSFTYNFKGITVDANGDMFFGSTQDSYGGTNNGVLMLPNESGNPLAPQFSSKWADAEIVSPIRAGGPVAIDPRGFLWIPNFNPTGMGSIGSTNPSAPTIPYTNNYVAYALGSISLGASAVGSQGTGGIVYYTFSGNGTPASTVTPGSFKISQPNSSKDFVAVTTNPLLIPATKTTPASVDTTVVPCTTGTAYAIWAVCPYWVAADPTVAGTVSAQLQMLDSSSNILSRTYLAGIGQGPEISFLGSNSTSSVGSTYTSPAQVATDSLGNIYVADSGQKKVFQFAPGSTSSSTPATIYTGTSPTGVSVDGQGNVFIGDTGSIYELNFNAGSLSSTPVSVQSGLGSHLNLASDSLGDVYVADIDNADVVKIANNTTQSTFFQSTTTIVDSGLFTAPTAVAVDSSDNLYVADGTKIDEVAAADSQNFVTVLPSLSGTVAGMAVDASGSLYLTEAGGLTWIPAIAGSLTSSAQVTLPTAAVGTPVSVALDRIGNVYVADSGTPSVTELSVNGSFDFAPPVVPLVEDDQEVAVYNIGSAPLTLANPTTTNDPSSPNTDFFANTAPDTPACGASTSTASGESCWFGASVLPSAAGVESSTISVASNATNAPTALLAVTADAKTDLRNITTTVISGITPTTYPGTESILVTVTSTAGTPSGQVILSLTGHQPSTESLGADGTATFTFSGLNGGAYNVGAVYQGTGTAGVSPNFGVSVAKTTFTVTPATPTLAIVSTTSTPSPAPYILVGGEYSLKFSVTSSLGTPTGVLHMMNGTALADPTQDPINLDNPVFSTSNLAQGVYSLTLVYAGDQNFAPATLSIPTFSVVPESINVTANPGSLTLTPGVTGTLTLTLTGLLGYGGEHIILAPQCISGLPKYSECTFSNNNIPFYPGTSSNYKQTVQMTISTNVPVNVSANQGTSFNATLTFAGMFGFGLFGLLFGKKTRLGGKVFTIVCLILLSSSLMFSVTACTNSGYTHTPPYPVVLTPAGQYQVGVIIVDQNSNANVIVPVPQPVFYVPVTVLAQPK